MVEQLHELQPKLPRLFHFLSSQLCNLQRNHQIFIVTMDVRRADTLDAFSFGLRKWNRSWLGSNWHSKPKMGWSLIKAESSPEPSPILAFVLPSNYKLLLIKLLHLVILKNCLGYSEPRRQWYQMSNEEAALRAAAGWLQSEGSTSLLNCEQTNSLIVLRWFWCHPHPTKKARLTFLLSFFLHVLNGTVPSSGNYGKALLHSG